MIGVLEFDSRRGLGIFLFTTASRTALGPTQPLREVQEFYLQNFSVTYRNAFSKSTNP
jgi:hypothetical protein